MIVEMTKTEKTLSEYGIRPSEMRLKIYNYLKKKRSAVSLADIYNSFLNKSGSNKTANKTTFFRVINIFLEKGIVHQINNGTGITKFAFSRESNESEKATDLHMHFYCTNCEETSCLPNSLPTGYLPKGYKTNEVNLILKGICKKCLI